MKPRVDFFRALWVPLVVSSDCTRFMCMVFQTNCTRVAFWTDTRHDDKRQHEMTFSFMNTSWESRLHLFVIDFSSAARPIRTPVLTVVLHDKMGVWKQARDQNVPLHKSLFLLLVFYCSSLPTDLMKQRQEMPPTQWTLWFTSMVQRNMDGVQDINYCRIRPKNPMQCACKYKVFPKGFTQPMASLFETLCSRTMDDTTLGQNSVDELPRRNYRHQTLSACLVWVGSVPRWNIAAGRWHHPDLTWGRSLIWTPQPLWPDMPLTLAGAALVRWGKNSYARKARRRHLTLV